MHPFKEVTMTIVTSTESVLAAARVSYARDQSQDSTLTGARINSNPTEADLIANDPTLENAILAAEDASTSTSGGVGGASGGGSSSGTPASGGGITAAKAAPATPDTSAVSAAVNGVSVTA
jgi:hypothetical protein